MSFIKSLTFGSDLHLQFRNSSLQSKELLLEGGFLSLQRCDLLLDSTVLCLLEVEVPFPDIKIQSTFLLQFWPARLRDSSSHQKFSLSVQIQECPSRFSGSGLLSYDYWVHLRCSLFVAEVKNDLLIRFGVCPWEKPGCCWNFVLFRRSYPLFDLP